MSDGVIIEPKHLNWLVKWMNVVGDSAIPDKSGGTAVRPAARAAVGSQSIG